MTKDGKDRTNKAYNKKTMLTLSLTVSYKKKLMKIAAQQKTSIAAIIHRWVIEHSDEVTR